jgi:hypothetical protein
MQWELWEGYMTLAWESRDHIEKHMLLKPCCQTSQGISWFEWG